MANLMLAECGEHLAREHHEQKRRLIEREGEGTRRLATAGDILPWERLSEETRALYARIMYSLLYRGVIVCTRTEHRVKFGLRDERAAADQPERQTSGVPWAGIDPGPNCEGYGGGTPSVITDLQERGTSPWSNL